MSPLPGPDSIKPPGCCGGEKDASEEVPGEFIVAGRDATEVFEPCEHALDEVALAVSLAIVTLPPISPRS